jgi:hypothetical protein
MGIHVELGKITRAGDGTFQEGVRYDPHNVDVYLGLEEAMEKAGERVRALQSFPELSSAPATPIRSHRIRAHCIRQSPQINRRAF